MDIHSILDVKNDPMFRWVAEMRIRGKQTVFFDMHYKDIMHNVKTHIDEVT